jgi:MFS family permease
MTGTPLADAQAPGGNRQMINAIIASVLGWSLDLFDLFILLYVAPVIGALFFPSTHATLSLAAVYASFAVTLLMRPIGSAVFGHYADVHGRKGAMMIAIVGVGVSTAAFGALPTIAHAGIAAPIMFLILRLVQGVFVGGVVASTHTIGTESVPAKWRGAMSGLVGGGGAGIGALLASFVFLITSSIFPGEAFAQWGWRFMFFSGLLSSLLGWFIFKNLEESPFFNELQQQKAASKATAAPSPVRTLFSSKYRFVLLINLLITFGGGAGYYLTSAISELPEGCQRSPQQRLVADPDGCERGRLRLRDPGRALSEKIGRKPTFLAAGVSALVLLPLCYLDWPRRPARPVTLHWPSPSSAMPACARPDISEREVSTHSASGTGLS